MTNTSATQRAIDYLVNARRLGLSDSEAYDVANMALDADVDRASSSVPELRFCLLAALEQFDTDDDFDDFRSELRTALGM